MTETGHVEQSTSQPSSTSSEGIPAVEQVEKKVLGNNYQSVEVVHRFADTHPWFHPVLAIGAIVIVVCIALVLSRYIRGRRKVITDN
jgi:hypothetical protein